MNIWKYIDLINNLNIQNIKNNDFIIFITNVNKLTFNDKTIFYDELKKYYELNKLFLLLYNDEFKNEFNKNDLDEIKGYNELFTELFNELLNNSLNENDELNNINDKLNNELNNEKENNDE